MHKNTKFFLGAIAVLFVLWIILRFVIGGPEDDWICQDGNWVKHGNPTAEMPKTPCEIY